MEHFDIKIFENFETHINNLISKIEINLNLLIIIKNCLNILKENKICKTNLESLGTKLISEHFHFFFDLEKFYKNFIDENNQNSGYFYFQFYTNDEFFVSKIFFKNK